MDRNSPLAYEAIIIHVLFYLKTTPKRACARIHILCFKNLFLNHKGEAIIIIKNNMALFNNRQSSSFKPGKTNVSKRLVFQRVWQPHWRSLNVQLLGFRTPERSKSEGSLLCFHHPEGLMGIVGLSHGEHYSRSGAVCGWCRTFSSGRIVVYLGLCWGAGTGLQYNSPGERLWHGPGS